MLSTELAIRAIRTLLPDCRATDRELADMVAAVATDQGLSVSFDGSRVSDGEEPVSVDGLLCQPTIAAYNNR